MPQSVNPAAVEQAVSALDTPQGPSTSQLREAVRALLATLASRAPGKSVEVRVPPYGAVQCVNGPHHTRGTPPNVVECEPLVFLRLAAGRLDFDSAVADGLVTASGVRADISDHLPLV